MAEDFQWAIKTGDINGVREYVEVKKHDVNAPDATVKRRTPLHYAADFGQVEVAKYLVSKGAKLDVKDGFGITPLLAAVYENHAEVVEFLLSKGADAKIKGPDGATAVEAAADDRVKELLSKRN
eukprot:TRINITY_DN6282_c0_g2_i2.p1 TRINITY_DN6282_c0_g2~~TRINITY_DN6282_c0_g2_i2.p1  ORF type:complete len:142 (-),score=43.59 TRINITY_DN6282_c0_g2_i2:575-946(-)